MRGRLRATLLGVETVTVSTREEPVRNITLRLTQLFNVTGHPAITIPCGCTPDGFPVGLQMAGHREGTTALLNVARRLEPLVDTDSIARGRGTSSADLSG